MANEVKRWRREARLATMLEHPEGRWVKFEDHDRIVADLKAEVEVLKNHRAEYEADCKRIEYFDDLHEKVATQVRVIEKLKLQRGTILHEKYAGFPLLAMNAESDLDKELAAIEKEGAKDEPNQR